MSLCRQYLLNLSVILIDLYPVSIIKMFICKARRRDNNAGNAI